MIIDHRTYTLAPRKLPEYLKLFEEHGLPAQQKYLDLAGYFTTEIGPLNQAIHLWRFENLGDMERRRAARNADPAWNEYLRLTAGMAVAQEDKIIRPAPFSPGPTAPSGDIAVIDHRTYTLAPRKLPEYLKLFEEHGLPVQQKHLRLVGYFFTEIGPLNQIIHMWGYTDLADMEERRKSRNADPAWKEYQKYTVGMVTAQETKIIRTTPFSPIR